MKQNEELIIKYKSEIIEQELKTKENNYINQNQLKEINNYSKELKQIKNSNFDEIKK